MRLLFFIFCIGIFTACQNPPKKQTLEKKRKELDRGQLTDKGTYTVDEIGWSIHVPPDWEIITKRETDARNERGKKMIEETFGAEADISRTKTLLNFQKDRFNSFLSNMEAFDETIDGSYDDQVNNILELIKKTYESKKIRAEYNIGATRIDGVMFDRIEAVIYSPDGEKTLLKQFIFCGLVNGYILSMNINYTNEDNKQVLMDAVFSSQFDIKKKN